MYCCNKGYSGGAAGGINYSSSCGYGGLENIAGNYSCNYENDYSGCSYK